jgi:vacuolar-type H+-ATPase subunit H
MNILGLLNNLKNLIEKGKPVPFSNMVMVDEKKLISLIEEIEKNFPIEFEKAKNILKEKEEIITEARERAKKIIEGAEDDKNRLIYESEIVVEAKEKADEIIKEAQKEAKKIKEEGEEFVRELLSKIDNYLIRARGIIEEGINNLMEDKNID